MYLPRSYSNDEYWFLKGSLATNLVTSREFQPLHPVVVLCHFGQTRNIYVATCFIIFSSTPASSATSGYAAVPEHFGQNEEPAGSNEERSMKEPSFVPKVDLIDAIVFLGMFFGFIWEF